MPLVTITPIDPNNLISDGPSDINANFVLLQDAVNDLGDLLIPSNNTLKLTNVATIPANSAEMATMTLTITSGNAFTVAPNGGTATFTISFDGVATGLKFVASGSGADKSTFVDLGITGTTTITGPVVMNELLNLNQTNGRIAMKYRVVQLVDNNTGSGATQPVDISVDQILYLDYDNSGGALANSSEINLDTTNLVDGQIIKLHCFRVNTSGDMKLWNGVGTAVFAYIDPAGTGYTDIATGTKPTFAPAGSPDTQSWIKCQWSDVGGGNFRLVILESLNVTNVS